MNSLLQHLQKARARHHLRNDLVLIKQPTANPSSTTEIDQDLKDLDQLLNQTQSKSETISTKSFIDDFLDLPTPQQTSITRQQFKADGTSVTIVKKQSGVLSRNSSVTNKTKTDPWWLIGDSSIKARDELVIPATSELVKTLLAKVGASNLNSLIAHTVNKVSQDFKSEEEISQKDLENAQAALLQLITAKGPLKTLFEDLEVTDIFVDSHKSITAIRSGRAFETPFSFRSIDEYKLFILGLLRNTNQILSPENPVIDLTLTDRWSSHVNIIDPCLTDSNEAKLAIHIPRKQSISFYDILQLKVVPPLLAAWLSELSACKAANILVTGPTRSGKTMLVAALLSAIGTEERVITIEDSPEIIVSTAQIEKLLTNTSGTKKTNKVELLNIASKRKPHRIVLGDIQGEEINKFLQILDMGYKGCISSVAAESALDAFWVLHDLMLETSKNLSEVIKRRLTRSFNIVISMGLINGRPCLIEINEAVKSSGKDFSFIPLIKFNNSNSEQRQWKIMSTESYWLKYLAEKGMLLSPGQGLIKGEELTETTSKG